MRNDGKEGKLASYIFFMKKILKNESCADFYADHQKPVQTGRKNKIKIYDFFYRPDRHRAGPVTR